MKRQLVPPEGYVWNPLLTMPRNGPCPCNSGKKFKKCHLPGMPRVIEASLVKDLKRGGAIGNG